VLISMRQRISDGTLKRELQVKPLQPLFQVR